MPWDKTPEDTETGDYSDARVDVGSLKEVWVEVEVQTEDGETEPRAFGFQVIPQEQVPYAEKSERVQKAAQKSREGGFNAMEYYISMLEYQIQETSFGAEDRLRTWLKTEAQSEIVEALEDKIVPPPLGEDEQREQVLEKIEEVVSNFAESPSGSWESTVEEFRAFVREELGEAEDRGGN